MSTPFIPDNMQHVFAQEGEHKTNKVRELIDVITDVKRRAMTNVRKYDIRTTYGKQWYGNQSYMAATKHISCLGGVHYFVS